MKETPILFSSEMVRAILENRKNQTRRVVRFPRHVTNIRKYPDIPGAPIDAWWNGRIKCPYGQPGDRLWVRETFGNHYYDNENSNATYFLYRADYPDGANGYWYEPEQINWCDFPRWRPSIHMPREAARIILEIDEIRVERLQDITEEDAKAEGCEKLLMETRSARNNLMNLWNSLYAKRGFGWDVNPRVWVVKFHRLEDFENEN